MMTRTLQIYFAPVAAGAVAAAAVMMTPQPPVVRALDHEARFRSNTVSKSDIVGRDTWVKTYEEMLFNSKANKIKLAHHGGVVRRLGPAPWLLVHRGGSKQIGGLRGD